MMLRNNFDNYLGINELGHGFIRFLSEILQQPFACLFFPCDDWTREKTGDFNFSRLSII